MGFVHEVIEAFRKAPSNSERGTKFEKLMVRYCELDPILSQQYDAVWRWIDWPGRNPRAAAVLDRCALGDLVDLIKKVTNVSVETMKIVDSLQEDTRHAL